MRSVQAVEALLDALAAAPADALEDQDLDFKEWNTRSRADAVKLVVEMAVCMANGGGGTVVLGVRDRVVGRASAILGVPLEVDPNLLKRAVYDGTDPKLMPQFEELAVPEGTGRLLVMQVYPGLPPYTDSAGQAKVRVGKECQPLTGTLRRQMAEESGETDFSARVVPGELGALLSGAAIERLRDAARKERAPEDLLRLGDRDLLASLGVLPDGRATVAALLLAGTSEALARSVPNHGWLYLQMQGATDYVDRLEGSEPLAAALERLNDRIKAENPLVTSVEGLYHFEYRTYPEIALREGLLNALCHRDFRVGGLVVVKHFPDKLELSSPGGLIAGITAENILHHAPAARNPLLVQALLKLRLINRSNLGIPRMFKALLSEGKAPPLVSDLGEAVRVTFLARPFSAGFRNWVSTEAAAGRLLDPDQLLVVRYLLTHTAIDRPELARCCQRSPAEADLIGAEMVERGYLLAVGETWCLAPELLEQLASAAEDPVTRAAVRRHLVLEALRTRAQANGPGLSNADVRALTGLDRKQVNQLIHELAGEGVQLIGHGRAARYVYAGP